MIDSIKAYTTRGILRRLLGGRFYAWVSHCEAAKLATATMVDESKYPESDLYGEEGVTNVEQQPYVDERGNRSFSVRLLPNFAERFEARKTCTFAYSGDVSITLYPCGSDWLLYARNHAEDPHWGSLEGSRQMLAVMIELMSQPQ